MSVRGSVIDREALAWYRERRDEFVGSSYASPFPDEDQAIFTGLSYFALNPDMAFAGAYVAGDNSPVQITSSPGTTSGYHERGMFRVEIAGAPYELTVLDDGDGNPFIAFGDETNGVSTYGGGRYVSLEVPEQGPVSIDFNLTTNPYCVYDEAFVCPLPPLENRIHIPIEAGEKTYDKP